jgi:hypothetical protein
MTTGKRTALKQYFKKNSIPTEGNFHDLIDNMLIKEDDGISKSADSALKITASKEGDVIELSRAANTSAVTSAVWSLSLEKNGKKGLSIGKNNDTSNCLFIDETTGDIGIGTDSIEERLHVQGNLYVDGDLTVTGHANKGKGGGTWGTLGSDKRLKEFPDGIDIDIDIDIEKVRIGNALKVLLQLNGVKYKWKQEAQEKYPTDFDDKEHVGFIAQNIEALALDEDIFSGWAKPDAGHYEINSEEFDALGVYPDYVVLGALTVESIRELDNKIETICQNGVIKAQINGTSGQKGLLFSQDNGTAAAWMRCTGGADNVLEIGTTGNIRLNTGGLVTFGNSAGKHLVLSSDQIMAKGSASSLGVLSVQKEGGRTEIGGDINVKGKVSIEKSLVLTGNMGIGTDSPTHKFHVLAQDAVGLFESSGGQAYLRLSTKEGIENRVEITNRPGGRLSLWTAGGGDAFNITKNGNVGVGTTNPTAKLHVAGDVVLGINENNKKFIFHSRTNGNGDFLQITHDKSDGGWEWGQGITIRRGGNVGVGTNNPRYKLEINGDVSVGIVPSTHSLGYGSKLHFNGIHPNTDVMWIARYNQKADVSYLRINIGDNAAGIHSDQLQVGYTSGGQWRTSFYADTDGTFSQSDERLKSAIDLIPNAIDKIKQIRGVQFFWKDNQEQEKQKPHKEFGVLAQELEKIVPNVVATDENGYKFVNYNGLIPLLIEAVKSQQQHLENLIEETDILKLQLATAR